MKYQPSSELTVWYRNRFKGNVSARAAKVGIVALARKLLIALWRFVETGLSLKVPEPAPPDAYVATGSIRRRGLRDA
ncbi:MAG: hypothetical protein R3E03_06330 [Novosphingobium sp.]